MLELGTLLSQKEDIYKSLVRVLDVGVLQYYKSRIFLPDSFVCEQVPLKSCVLDFPLYNTSI
jgi:hypothetical protein